MMLWYRCTSHETERTPGMQIHVYVEMSGRKNNSSCRSFYIQSKKSTDLADRTDNGFNRIRNYFGTDIINGQKSTYRVKPFDSAGNISEMLSSIKAKNDPTNQPYQKNLGKLEVPLQDCSDYCSNWHSPMPGSCLFVLQVCEEAG